jgi:hypothetical protein
MCRGATLRGVFHIQLRQFPNVSREFNLAEDELRARILRPWLAGEMVRSGERRWAPERARLTIYEAPALRSDEIGMGRGWANVTRTGEDVTEKLLAAVSAHARSQPAPAAADELERCKQLILARAGNGSFDIRECVRLAEVVRLGTRASERLALAEQAVWELLHARVIELTAADADPPDADPPDADPPDADAPDADPQRLDPSEWQQALLDWETWSGGRRIDVSATGAGG